MSEEAWTEESLGQKSVDELKALVAAQGAEATGEEPAALVAQLLRLQAEKTPASEAAPEAPPVKRTKTEDGEAATGAEAGSSSTVFIEGFVRPLNVKTLQSMLEARAGRVTDLWLNAIKTHCYATFARPEDAARARAELQGVHWPETNEGTLTVRASSAAEAARAKDDEAAALAADAAARSSSSSSTAAQPEPAGAAAGAESEDAATPADERVPPEPPVEVPLPDEYAQHYNKTATQPTLYWLPRDGKRLDQ